MYKFLKNSLFILIIFIIGIAVGSYYNPFIQDLMERIGEKTNHGSKTPELHFCPPAAEVVKHQYSSEAFQVGTLYWQMDYQGWKAPDSIGFMQALINQNNNLVCYYHWRNPTEKGTYLWMTIHLSPSVNQIVKPYGGYWAKEEKQLLCTAGINACAFILSESSKRIIPQN
ncbi:Uncharacterised protein [Legionella steigerwaltii]|uniref:Uncharacterized protein n=1 Tax=Legionella steigerwaltii TaxID=460 RepID=A0A378LA00_9GAMM|nr:hypothetical protein [Legionella steigerwaltii]KTD71966.1 hypothetical protein Lstg_2822 [Legionella steigerwaltii]STY23885.1 Uncharacterised protein [Legionella steigerwaltii]